MLSVLYSEINGTEYPAVAGMGGQRQRGSQVCLDSADCMFSGLITVVEYTATVICSQSLHQCL